MILEPEHIQEYRKLSAINYSLMSRFSISPGHALTPMEPKNYFEFGSMWELYIRQYFTKGPYFDNRYYITDKVSGMIPNEILLALQKGTDLKTLYKYTKTGKPDGRYKSLHAWIDVCLDNPGKIPVSKEDMKRIGEMLKGFLNMQFLEISMYDLLADSEWETPFTWEVKEITKKCLFDIIASGFIGDDGVRFYLDLKTTASIDQFVRMYYKSYWIQSEHYSEGSYFHCKHKDDNMIAYEPLVFLVTETQEPYNSQCFMVDEMSRDYQMDDYNRLVGQVATWIKNGKPNNRWLPTRKLTYYGKKR